MMYGICCTGGPKRRAVSVGQDTVEFAANDGTVFYFPEENAFKFADNYAYAKRKDAEADIKKARERRMTMFLPYDGFSVCKIVRKK